MEARRTSTRFRRSSRSSTVVRARQGHDLARDRARHLSHPRSALLRPCRVCAGRARSRVAARGRGGVARRWGRVGRAGGAEAAWWHASSRLSASTGRSGAVRTTEARKQARRDASQRGASQVDFRQTRSQRVCGHMLRPELALTRYSMHCSRSHGSRARSNGMSTHTVTRGSSARSVTTCPSIQHGATERCRSRRTEAQAQQPCAVAVQA